MREIDFEEVKSIAASIFQRLDIICRENNLTYFAWYGTLLGVVRHQGFIPWDDDIDIVMPREDYLKLESLIIGDESLRFITVNNTADTIYPHGKLIDTRTELYVHGFKHVEGYGIGIDIFPLDYMPEKMKLRNRRIKHALFLRKLIEHSACTEVGHSKSFKRQFLRSIAFYLSKPLNTQRLIKRLERFSMTTKKSKYIGVTWDAGYNVDDIFPPKEMPFENFTVMVPKCYDKLLRETYGDYMKYPPKEEQQPKHHYDCYMKD